MGSAIQALVAGPSENAVGSNAKDGGDDKAGAPASGSAEIDSKINDLEELEKEQLDRQRFATMEQQIRQEYEGRCLQLQPDSMKKLEGRQAAIAAADEQLRELRVLHGHLQSDLDGFNRSIATPQGRRHLATNPRSMAKTVERQNVYKMGVDNVAQQMEELKAASIEHQRAVATPTPAWTPALPSSTPRMLGVPDPGPPQCNWLPSAWRPSEGLAIPRLHLQPCAGTPRSECGGSRTPMSSRSRGSSLGSGNKHVLAIGGPAEMPPLFAQHQPLRMRMPVVPPIQLPHPRDTGPVPRLTGSRANSSSLVADIRSRSPVARRLEFCEGAAGARKCGRYVGQTVQVHHQQVTMFGGRVTEEVPAANRGAFMEYLWAPRTWGQKTHFVGNVEYCAYVRSLRSCYWCSKNDLEVAAKQKGLTSINRDVHEIVDRLWLSFVADRTSGFSSGKISMAAAVLEQIDRESLTFSG